MSIASIEESVEINSTDICEHHNIIFYEDEEVTSKCSIENNTSNNSNDVEDDIRLDSINLFESNNTEQTDKSEQTEQINAEDESLQYLNKITKNKICRYLCCCMVTHNTHKTRIAV